MLREKKALLEKLSMVIDAFFGEVGTELFKLFSFAPGSIENSRAADHFQ